MHEIIVNLHMHTRYSDGSGSHQDIGAATLKAGVDAVIVTDHNILVKGHEKVYKENNKRALLLIGEEIHDQSRLPQKSHLLVFNAKRELATLASNPQELINGVREAGGLSFLAHPFDPAAPAIKETDITWDDWQVSGYTGIELWNGLSEIKNYTHSKLHAIFYAYLPQLIGQAPPPDMLKKWDALLANGQKVVAIGGSDAHAFKLSLGPLHRTVFPYAFHFNTINTHVFVESPLTGDLETDRELIYSALEAGHAFVAYDLPAPTRGFRFTARAAGQTALMGDELTIEGGITLQAHVPQNAHIRLIKDGEIIKEEIGRQSLTHITTEAGVYRVEVSRAFWGKLRGWIYSNPIYLREA